MTTYYEMKAAHLIKRLPTNQKLKMIEFFGSVQNAIKAYANQLERENDLLAKILDNGISLKNGNRQNDQQS